MMLAGELIAVVIRIAGLSVPAKIYNGFHVLQMAAAMPLVYTAWNTGRKNISPKYLRGQTWNRIYFLFPISIVFYLIGDLISSNILLPYSFRVEIYASPLWQYSIANIILSVVFIMLSPAKVSIKYPMLATRDRLWPTAIIWPLMTAFMLDRSSVVLMPDMKKYTFAVFILFSNLMFLSGCWVAMVWKWRGAPITVGALFLWLSGYANGARLSGSQAIVNNKISWALHFIGILLIIQLLRIGSENNFADRSPDLLEQAKQISKRALKFIGRHKYLIKVKKILADFKARIFKSGK